MSKADERWADADKAAKTLQTTMWLGLALAVVGGVLLTADAGIAGAIALGVGGALLSVVVIAWGVYFGVRMSRRY